MMTLVGFIPDANLGSITLPLPSLSRCVRRHSGSSKGEKRRRKLLLCMCLDNCVPECMKKNFRYNQVRPSSKFIIIAFTLRLQIHASI
jgi:uncharacterized metal-binding protein